MNGRLFIRTEVLYQSFFPSPSGSEIWGWETAARVWARASICFVFQASNESLQGVIVSEYLHSSKSKILWRILVKLFVASVLGRWLPSVRLVYFCAPIVFLYQPSFRLVLVQCPRYNFAWQIFKSLYLWQGIASSQFLLFVSLAALSSLRWRWLKSAPTISSNQLGNLQDVLLN